MATCAACMFEIEDAETVVQAAACGHDCHEYCVPQVDDGSTPCYECHPEKWDEPIDMGAVVAGTTTDSSFVATDTDTAMYTEPVVDASPAPDPTGTATTTDATTETPVDFGPAQAAAAVTLRAAIDRAKAAVSAAEATLGELTDAGATRAAVTAAVEGDVKGWGAALDYCNASAPGWDPYADGAATWPADQGTIDEMNGGTAGLDSQSTILDTGQGVLDGMSVVDLGEGVFDTLSATGERNVAEMAVGGPGWTGHNLHALTDDLKGWSSIRAEEGFVVIVRWSGASLQVGATGKHVQRGKSGDDYALDNTVATSFEAGLAWKPATGAHKLVQAGA